MKPFLFRTLPVFLTAAVIVLAGCDAPTSMLADEESAAEFASGESGSADLTTVLTQELSLTTTQQAALQGEVERHDRPDRNPGGLWFVAARLQNALTDDQKARLFRLADAMDDHQLHKLVGVYGPCLILRPGDDAGRIPFRLIADLLSDEQQAEAEAIRARYRDEIAAIRERVESGELTREEAEAAIRALHDAMADEIRALLTEEQIAALEERIAARGDNAEDHLAKLRQAMIEALGLNDEQVAQLDELHRTQCTALEDLIDKAHAGEITREEFRAGLERLVAQKSDAYAGILDAVQLESAEIHDALLVVHARRFIHHITDGGPDGRRRQGGPDRRRGNAPGG